MSSYKVDSLKKLCESLVVKIIVEKYSSRGDHSLKKQ
jgi:hypothetical protein